MGKRKAGWRGQAREKGYYFAARFLLSLVGASKSTWKEPYMLRKRPRPWWTSSA